MVRLLLLFFAVFFTASCAEVQYLDEALRLKEFSDEGDARDALIARRQAQFQGLVSRIARGDLLKDMATKKDVVAQLGDPVLIEPEKKSGAERWLYRDPVKYFDTPKVYFFVDAAGRVLRWASVGITQSISQTNHESSEH
jgi:hypothetical protein